MYFARTNEFIFLFVFLLLFSNWEICKNQMALFDWTKSECQFPMGNLNFRKIDVKAGCSTPFQSNFETSVCCKPMSIFEINEDETDDVIYAFDKIFIRYCLFLYL